LYEVLALPSAKFETIDTAALRNCITKPNFSSAGNEEVAV
jgi:hypothetical protein